MDEDPSCDPVVLQRHPLEENLPSTLPKTVWGVPRTITLGHFAAILTRKMEPKPQNSPRLMIDQDRLVDTQREVGLVYMELKKNDDLMYISLLIRKLID